jgi:hypothetical protein
MDTIEQFSDVKEIFDAIKQKGYEEAKKLARDYFTCEMDTPYHNYKSSGDFDATRPPMGDTDDNTIKGYVLKIFNHYDVNPSDNIFCNRINQTYVTSNLKQEKLTNHLPVANKDGVNVDFFDAIIKRMKKIGAPMEPEEKFIYLTGAKGAGKTSFFNYFITQKETQLNELCYITIRINVMRISEDTTMVDAIKYKICRILFTYYCGDYLNIKRLEKREIKSYFKSTLEYIARTGFGEEAVKECHMAFSKENDKRLKKIDEKYKKICDILLEEISNAYKFVVILDNFDQLNPNSESTRKYKNRFNEKEKLCTDVLSNYCLFIVAIRHNTYVELSRTGRIIRDDSCWCVKSPATYDMVIKRLDYVRSNTPDERLKRERLDFIEQCVVLIGRGFDVTDSINDLQSACQKIDEVFLSDKRLILNLVNRLIESIPDKYSISNLDSFLNRYKYRLFESLLIRSKNENSQIAFGYCRSFYKYREDKEGKLHFQNMDVSAYYESSYIPNIYKFPATINNKNMRFMPFLKIRILQFLQNSPNSSPFTISDILNEIFSYRKDAVLLACTELREDQSIASTEPLEEVDYQQESINTTPMTILERGCSLLNILPHSANFLAVCLEQMFLPKNMLNKIPIGNYYTEIDPINARYANARDSFFIIRNVFCSLPIVLGMLKKIEEIELIKYQKYIKKKKKVNTPSYYNEQKDFKWTSHLEKSSIESIEKIFDTYFASNTKHNDEEQSYRKNRRRTLTHELHQISE